MPDSLRYIIVLGALAGIVYGVAWWLASDAPEPVQIEKSLSSDRLRN